MASMIVVTYNEILLQLNFLLFSLFLFSYLFLKKKIMILLPKKTKKIQCNG